jgi:endonuclease/exonuclease/phosphatase (EEP) superfamily protein YafD
MTTAVLSNPPPAKTSRISTGLLWMLVLAVTLVTCLAAFADRLWLGDLFSFSRPQLALAVLFLLCVAIFLRRWLAAVALGAILAVNASPLVVFDAPRAASAETTNLRMVSANLLYDNETPSRFGEILAGLSPDIVITQEARFDWPDVLRSLPGFPYLAGPEVLSWSSNLVLSRYPLRARLVPDMPASGGRLGGGKALRVESDVPGRTQPLVIYAIHAPTPRTFDGWQARNRYLDTLAERIAAEPEGTAVLLAGDWNTPVWSPAFSRTLFLSGLLATERSVWPSATRLFASFGGFAFGTSIDHVAVSRGIAVAGLSVGPDFGSDHLPVVADLKLPCLNEDCPASAATASSR